MQLQEVGFSDQVAQTFKVQNVIGNPELHESANLEKGKEERDGFFFPNTSQLLLIKISFCFKIYTRLYLNFNPIENKITTHA